MLLLAIQTIFWSAVVGACVIIRVLCFYLPLAGTSRHALIVERQRVTPGITIYLDTPAQGLIDSITTPAFAAIPTGTVDAADDDVIPEEAQTLQCTSCGGIYPLSVFVDRSRRPEPFTNCVTCRPPMNRVLPPGRPGMQSCSRCSDLLPLAQFIDLARRCQSFKLCPGCRPVVMVPVVFRSQYCPGTIQRHDLGRMEYICRFCKALYWLAEGDIHSSQANPLLSRCCKHGAVQLTPIQPPPPYLCWLLTGDDTRAKEFRDRIHQYNSAFVFTSISYTPDQRVQGAYKPFLVAGELFHMYGPLEPREGVSPAFAQLWLLEDQKAAIPIRCAVRPA